ncbi:MAG TPA: hypothetical protein PKW63_15210 [Vicinamibacterales bacterium]|nr:hypothetical protein [Vicinamibacterales bacterium]
MAVHDLTVHPRENDLVIATYGRAIWAGDITPLQELSADVLAKKFHLFAVEPKARYGFSLQGMNYHLFGDKYLEVPNEPEALVVQYHLAAAGTGQAQITLADAAGRTVRQLTGPTRAGLNRVNVPLAGGGGGRGGGAGRGGAPGGTAASGPLAVGTYAVTVDIAGEKQTVAAMVRERILARR